MKIKYRSPIHLDRQNAQLGTKHEVHCRLTMGLMIGTTCLYSNFDFNQFVSYGGLLLALYDCNGLVAPGLSLNNFWVHFNSVCFLVVFPAALPYTVRHAPGKRATVPIYKVLVTPSQESNSRPTRTEADALTTRPRAGHNLTKLTAVFHWCTGQRWADCHILRSRSSIEFSNSVQVQP